MILPYYRTFVYQLPQLVIYINHRLEQKKICAECINNKYDSNNNDNNKK